MLSELLEIVLTKWNFRLVLYNISVNVYLTCVTPSRSHVTLLLMQFGQHFQMLVETGLLCPKLIFYLYERLSIVLLDQFHMMRVVTRVIWLSWKTFLRANIICQIPYSKSGSILFTVIRRQFGG